MLRAMVAGDGPAIQLRHPLRRSCSDSEVFRVAPLVPPPSSLIYPYFVGTAVETSSLVQAMSPTKVLLKANFSVLAIFGCNCSDRAARAHNPKVVGSNPTPATIETLVGASRA